MFKCCCFLLVNVPVYFVVVWYECVQTVELYGRYHFLAIPIRICCNFSEKIQIKLIFQWTVAKNNIPIPWIDLSNGEICMNCANKHQLTFPLPQPLKYSYVVCVVIYINAPIQFIFISLVHAVILFDIPINNNENFTNYKPYCLPFYGMTKTFRFIAFIYWAMIPVRIIYELCAVSAQYIIEHPNKSSQGGFWVHHRKFISTNRNFSHISENEQKKNLRKMHQTLNTK